MEELLFSKVTEEISTFCNSANNFITWINIFRKEAPLKISRNFLLNEVLGLQPTGSNSTKNELLIKILRNVFHHLMEFLCCKLQAYKLQPLVLPAFKTPENSYAVEFLFTEAEARMFSSELLLKADFWKAPRKAYKCKIEELHHEIFTEKFPKNLE